MALKLDLSATISRSMVRTAQELAVAGGRSAIMGPISFPTGRISGSGEWTCYMTYELAGSNRVVMQRRTTVDGTGAVTRDVLECRMSPAGVDATPSTFTWTAIPSGAVYFKMGFSTDLKTVSFQVAAADGAFSKVVDRVATGFDFSGPGFWEIGLFRASGDVIPASMTVTRAYGNTSPNPNPGGTSAGKGDTALHFAAGGANARVFPTYTGEVGALVFVGRPADVARILVPIAQSQGAQSLLDTFTRANGALGASWATVTTSSGAETQQTISSNQAIGSTSTGTSAAWATSMGSNDHGVYYTVKSKPANPASTTFNWLRAGLRMSGSGATLQGYQLSLSLTTAGVSSYFLQRYFNGNTSGTAMNAGAAVNLGNRTIAVGDAIGARIVGSTLQGWYRPVSTGVWEQVGSNVTDTGVTTGQTIAMMQNPIGTTATSVDDFGGGPETLGGSFPADQGGRYMRINPHTAITGVAASDVDKFAYVNGTLNPVGAIAAGAMPNPRSWIGAYIGRDPTSGVVSIRIYNPATNTHTHIENAGTLSAGSFTQTAAARFVLGGRNPQAAGGDQGFEGDMAGAALGSTPISLADWEAMWVSPGMTTATLLGGFPNCQRAYDMTQLVNATDQITDLKGSNHEITGERVGSFTIITDLGNVPLGVAAGGGGGTPTPTISVPDPVNFVVSDVRVSSADTTLGHAHLHVDSPVASAAYTPNATPIRFYISTDGASWTAISPWQSSTEFDYNSLPIDDAEGTGLRFFSAQYRDNSSTPVVGNFADAVPVSIQIAGNAIDPVTGIVTPRFNGGLMSVYWDPNPTDDAVTEYDVFVTKRGAVFPVGPFYAGPGIAVAGGTQVTDALGHVFSVGGKLTTTSQISGLDDSADYDVGIEAHRPSAL